MRITPATIAVLVLTWGLTAAGGVEAGLEPASGVQFTAKPTVHKVGDRYEIRFTLSRAADVEVGIVDSKGVLVRHLAAGLLGAAPEMTWDGKDDLGEVPAGGPFTVRVRAGVEPRLEKMLGSAPGGFFGGVEAVSVGPAGEIYVLNCEVFKFGRVEMIVLDRNGKYLRTIIPYSANTPKERTESVGHFIIDGQRVPILFSGHVASVYPLVCGMRSQTMAWHPKGYLIAASSIGSARENGPPRYLLAFHSEGGAPEGVSFVGPQICPPRGFLGGDGERDNCGMDRLAVSPDGEWVYLVPCYEKPKKAPPRQHGVYRVKWTDKTIGDLWLGKPEPGADDEHFDDPQGIAVDKAGLPSFRLFICDRGNNRVKVYSPDGKLIGKFDAESPEQIVVEPGSGRIFILSRLATHTAKTAKLLAFEPFDKGAKLAFELASPDPIRSIALDATPDPTMPGHTPPRIWAVVAGLGRRTGKLVPFTICADKFEAGQPVKIPATLDTPSFLAATPDGSSVIVREHMIGASAKPFVKFDVASGKMESVPLKGCDIAIDAKGNIYTLDGYETHSLSRYDANYNPLPYPATQSNKLAVKFTSYGADMAMRGQCVDLGGNVYVMHFVNHVLGANLDVYGPDGRLKKHDLVAGLGSADSGIGVDAAGNLYVGVNVKDADRPLPDPFGQAGRVPTLNWIWWKNPAFARPAPWSYIYCNPYLFHMGQVFKFGPEGGAIYGAQQPAIDLPIASPGTELDKAPAGADSFKSAYLAKDVKVAGARWHYPGVGSIGASFDGPLPDPGCTCLPSHLCTDLWGRTFAPNCFLFSVDMLDPAGRLVRRIGHYGNNDSPGGSVSPTSEIALLQPTACAYANDRLFVSDTGNRRVLVIRLAFAAEASCELK